MSFSVALEGLVKLTRALRGDELVPVPDWMDRSTFREGEECTEIGALDVGAAAFVCVGAGEEEEDPRLSPAKASIGLVYVCVDAPVPEGACPNEIEPEVPKESIPPKLRPSKSSMSFVLAAVCEEVFGC